MRNISFALTRNQFRAKTKTVTRRLGWTRLRVGELLQGVEKCQGLKKGEKIQALGIIRVASVRSEPLNLIVDEPSYGAMECDREGFDHLSPSEFVEFFCKSHRGCTPGTEVTRIQFEYVDSREMQMSQADERATEAEQRCMDFVQGAKWWEWIKTGATMWQSDQNAAHDAAKILFSGELTEPWPPEYQPQEPRRKRVYDITDEIIQRDWAGPDDLSGHYWVDAGNIQSLVHKVVSAIQDQAGPGDAK